MSIAFQKAPRIFDGIHWTIENVFLDQLNVIRSLQAPKGSKLEDLEWNTYAADLLK